MSMKNSSRSREQPDPRSFAARKGHLPQLSISDDNHHVTEAIGHMYGEDDSPSSPRSSGKYSIRSDKSTDVENDVNGYRHPLPRKTMNEHRMANGGRMAPLLESQITSPSSRRTGWDGIKGSPPVSPLNTRETSPLETATTQFPLNDIDYESSPAAVAQELSNLQALRRMSMDVGATGDPDLPQLNAAAIPTAPSPAASEDDSARLFWVPARLHPELAPKEFKTFLESKAEQIRRRSGELSSFSSPMSSRSNSLSVESKTGSLRRRKSMLSKEFDSPLGYQDGADILEWKKYQEQDGQPVDPNLEELESLVSGGVRSSFESTDPENGDVILPSIPGSSLKRSTRTKYQRPESRKGPTDRSTYAERAKRRAAAGSQSDSSSITPSVTLVPSERSFASFSTDVSNLASTLRDPYSEADKGAMNFSRPGNRSPSPPPKDPKRSGRIMKESNNLDQEDDNSSDKFGMSKTVRGAQNGPLASSVAEQQIPQIPQIIESPPQEDHPVRTSSMIPPQSNVFSLKMDPPKSSDALPSRERPKTAPTSRPGMPPRQSGSVVSTGRPSSRGSNMPPKTNSIQALEQPSPLPGHDNNTSNLSFIPTLTVDKRQEQKKKEEKKSGWSWRRGKDEQDKEKKEDKSKARPAKSVQSHDNTRLDVLQTSIDGPKSRESLVLDRESLKLEEERRKESQRKSSGEKKEKESLFSSIFGGKRNKAEKEAHRKAQERLSPEPPYRELKPDVDYNWTRFSILEERAIYRMAHIKLANPRRALYSQVLLSNFMYSYLAKVQQMHPQMNLPTSAKQQRKQKEQQLQQQHQQHQQQQPDEFTQYQRYQQQHGQQSSSPYGPSSSRENSEHDSNTYDFNYSRESQQSQQYENSNHKPELSASPSFSSERHQGPSGGQSYTIGRNGDSHTSHLQPQQRQHQHQQRATPGYGYDEDDDDDDDMW